MYQKIIKENNENKIFQYLFKSQKNFVINDISEALNMSFPTVKRVIDILIKKNIILECDKIGDGVGRKAREYSFNPSFCYSIGVKISPTSLKIILINGCCEILKEKDFYYLQETSNIITCLTLSIENFLADLDKDIIKKLIGIGIATRGIVNKEKDFVEFSSSRTFSLKALNPLKEKFNIPILIENESNLSVIAESIMGYGQNLNHFIVLTLSNSISCSTFQNDQQDIFSFKAGRIHHMNINPDGNLCECGSRGCLGAYISDDAIISEFQKFFPNIKSFDEIFQPQYLNTKFGNLIINNYVKHLAIGIKNLLFYSNPKKLIITGEICKYKDLIYKNLLNNIYTPNHIFYRGEDTILFSKFQEKSNILGAAIFPIIDSLF